MYSVALAVILAVSSTPPLTPPQITLSEAEFLAALDPGHPAFAVLAEAEGLARADVIQAATYENPEIEMVREAPSAADEQFELTVAWQPPRPGRRRLLMASAEGAVDAARAGVLAAKMKVRLSLRQTFAEWAVAVARVERSRVHVDRINELAVRERHRADRGETSGLEARRLELAVVSARARLALDDAAALKAGATARGWRPDLSADVVPLLPVLQDSTSAKKSIAATAARHARLTALSAELESARLAQEASALVARWPKLVTGWQRQEEAEGPILGLAWTVPVAHRGQAERSRAQTRVEAAEGRLELARRQIEAERQGALAAYELLASATSATAAATVDHAALIEAATTAFRYGEVGLTDLLETLRSALDTELAGLDLHAAALAAHRDLELVTGRALDTPGL